MPPKSVYPENVDHRVVVGLEKMRYKRQTRSLDPIFNVESDFSTRSVIWPRFLHFSATFLSFGSYLVYSQNAWYMMKLEEKMLVGPEKSCVARKTLFLRVKFNVELVFDA